MSRSSAGLGGIPGPLAAAGLLLAASPASAAPLPNSLRLVRTATDVRLSWSTSGPSDGVFRDVAPDRVRSAANRIATAAGGTHDDPLAPLGAGPYFYQVGETPACFLDADCDDAVACTADRCDPVSGCEHLPSPSLGTPVELAGLSLARYPYFDRVRAFNQDAAVEVAIDPTLHPAVAGRTCDVFVVAERGLPGWCADPTLIDVRGAPDARTFATGSIRAATFPLIAPLQLPADAGMSLGVGYDVVLDCDRDGRLGPADYVDGVLGEAGLYLVSDLTLPGPLAVSTFDEVGPLPPWPGPWTDEGDDLRVTYPALLDDPSFTGTFPLVVVSHGNGHRFSWYDYLMTHLASHGFVVMSHDNNTFPGIETASRSTLRFTDRLLAEQALLGGGVLDGHVDASRIAWIGHSRGGEGVARAYDRIADEGWTPARYSLADIVLVASIAPTDYLGAPLADPHGVAYALLYGSADGDVSGCAAPDTRDSFNLYERAAGTKSSEYVQGADHNDFNCCGVDDFDGPPATEIGPAEAQQVAKAHYLALLQRHLRGNLPARDFLWRQAESLRPSGVLPTTIVDRDFKDGAASAAPSFVLDDFQGEPALDRSRSGGSVTGDVRNRVEGLLNDSTGGFNNNPADPMNGMTRVNLDEDPDDVQRGTVFDWGAGGGDVFLEFEVPVGERDFRDDAFLSLRACQGTRHPETTAELADLEFAVTLVDESGGASTIGIGAYGGGIEEPYQRTGCGSTGAGWQNEFEVIRIRLEDFMTDGAAIDLAAVRAVRLELGAGFGSAQGRIGLDDLMLTRE